MLTRRLVRIKTLQALYAWQQSDGATPSKGLIALKNTLQQTYDAYLFLLEFPWHLKEYLDSEKEREKSKYYPDKEIIRQFGLLHNTTLATTLLERVAGRKRRYFTTNWNTLAESFDGIYNELKNQDFVRDYLVFDQPGFEQQQFFMEEFYTFLFNGCEPFHQCMEEAYSAWNDDEELFLKEILRSISTAKEGQTIRLAEQDDPEGDEIKFGLKLFENVAGNSKGYEEQIADITDNWDPSRIAVLDLIAIKMALAEFLHFPMIPLKVTINEYLDIIKDYSTPSSSRFLNGILDKMRKKLETTGEIRKAGRGLRDN